jgi:ubiquinone/menaquinone biosynthesis C-methylase UbiE
VTTIWDYSGLIAAAYDPCFGAEPFWDQAFFEQRLAANGGRALEVACGTGRLLLPLLRDGLEVEGLDTSCDMLERLRAKARAMNLAPVLHEAPMQDFDLPGHYRTVFVPAGSFGILVEPEEISAALGCFLRALEPGGEALISVSEASAADEPITDWRERRNVRVPEYDAHVVIHERTAYEDDGRIQRWFLRYTVDRPGQPQEVFFREHRLRHYSADEFRVLLAEAGFEGIVVRRGYTEPQSSDPDDDLVFCARRPG